MGRARGDVRRQFGNRVRELRKAAGFTQEAFAAQVDLDRSYMGAVERGSRNISLLTIKRIADGLGVPVRELF